MKQDDEPFLFDDPAIQDITQANDAHPAQALIAWAVARDTAVIPKSTDPDHIRSNLESADLELSDTELDRIEPLDRHFCFSPDDAFRTQRALYANIFDDRAPTNSKRASIQGGIGRLNPHDRSEKPLSVRDGAVSECAKQDLASISPRARRPAA